MFKEFMNEVHLYFGIAESHEIEESKNVDSENRMKLRLKERKRELENKKRGIKFQLNAKTKNLERDKRNLRNKTALFSKQCTRVGHVDKNQFRQLARVDKQNTFLQSQIDKLHIIEDLIDLELEKINNAITTGDTVTLFSEIDLNNGNKTQDPLNQYIQKQNSSIEEFMALAKDIIDEKENESTYCGGDSKLEGWEYSDGDLSFAEKFNISHLLSTPSNDGLLSNLVNINAPNTITPSANETKISEVDDLELRWNKFKSH